MGSDVLLLDHGHHLLVLEELHVLLGRSLLLHLSLIGQRLLSAVEHLGDLGQSILLVELPEGGHVQTDIFWNMVGLLQGSSSPLQQLSLTSQLHANVWQGHLQEVSIELHQVLRELIVDELGVKSLLDSERMGRIALSLDEVQLVVAVPLELGVLEHLVCAALSLGLVKVIHVKLSDEGGEIAVFEVKR